MGALDAYFAGANQIWNRSCRLKVNIFNLAKNAGTSVEQIERFYAKHLPLSREMAKNLQSFGEE